jgi:transcriptional regulator with XRE-family HTH domain
MDIRGRLARNVKERRAARGWSQEDLAEASGLDRTYISGIERRVRNPTIEIVERLAKALKTPASTLLE